jgi:hypothetical protein
MAGSFEVGSITAELLLDVSKYGKTVQRVLQGAKQFSKELKERLGKGTEAKLVDDRRVLSRFRKIGQAVTRLATTVKTKLGGAFRAALRFSVRAPITALRTLGRAAVATGKRLRATFGGILGRSIRTLRRSLTGVSGALAAVGVSLGAFAAVRRAKDVEGLRTAFENLTGAIGENANLVLRDLRKATRGAVSDLELFRVANNAALLGVMQSREGYTELAELARRLGRAAGRDTVEAINDLTIGIGRQSRLILDNLGIIVRVEDAQEKYASSIGKTVDSLTEQDKRTAFLNATLESARRKVATLGPDVETLADAYGRFAAQISNTATTISEAFVGKGPFAAIADWLENNQLRIKRFATFVAGAFKATFDFFKTIIDDLFSSESVKEFGEKLSRAVRDAFRIIGRLVSTLIKTIFSSVGFLALKLSLAIMASLGNAILEEITVQFVKFGVKIRDEFVELVKRVPGAELVSAAFNLGEAIGEAAFGSGELFVGPEPGADFKLKQGLEKNQQAIDQIAGETLDDLVSKLGAATDKAGTDVLELAQEIKEQGGVVGKAGVQAFADWEKAIEDARKASTKQLKDLSANSQLAARALRAVTDQFRQMLTPFQERLRTLRVEVQTIGLEESTAELKKFDLAFEEIRDGLAPEDLDRLEETRAKLAGLLDQRDAAKGLAEATKTLKEFELEVEEFQASLVGIEKTEATSRIIELERGFNKFATSLWRSNVNLHSFFDTVNRMRGAVDQLKEATAFADLEDAIRVMRDRTAEARIELESIGRTDLENKLAKINREYDFMIEKAREATEALIEQKIATGATEEEINKLTAALARFSEQAEALRQVEIKTTVKQEEVEKLTRAQEEEVQAISSTLEQGLSTGIKNALRNGEGAAQVFANVLGGFLDKAINDSVNALVSKLKGSLDSLVGAGFGGLATGLLGIGGAILENLDSESSSTNDDFDTSINSSEAVRGVVAGPTNVAISKVGESLKSAMRTTELLLEQILQSIQVGGGAVGTGGGTGGGLSGNAALPLSTSSTT